ncbi:MAG: restriction endonuclease subunit S [Anaerolineales bacterium]|nr:MAG: restriction endonuclease subunit S [Anaerolineales bacterium]
MKKGWKVERLGDVIQLEYGKALPDSQRKSNGKYPVYGANGEKDRTNEFLYDKPSIIVGRKGSAGEINLTEKKFWALDVSYYVTFDDKKYDLRFLYYLLSNLELTKLAKGVKPGINRNEVYSIEVNIPPLPEQKRIVAMLDETFAALAQVHANAERNRVNAREVFEGTVREVFENRGDDWEENKLQEVCELKSGTTISTSLEREEGDVLYVKVSDMNLSENLIEIQTSSRFVNSEEINHKQIIPEGAIIFPKRGGAIATNKKRKIIKPTIVDLNTMAIIPSKKIDKDFLYHWFQLFDLNTISNGANVPQINHYSFDDVCIPYPKSLAEQRLIVSRLDGLAKETRRLEEVYEKKMEDVEELRKSVLKEAFQT